MKKILSFMLVLAMLAMMCINVSAANVIGTHGGGNGVEDGVVHGNAWTHQNHIHDIKANVSGNEISRYAVDLEYTRVSIVISGDVEWNVDTLKYDGTKKVSVDGAEEELVNGQTVNNIGKFTVTNYSNEPVTIKADVSKCPTNPSVLIDTIVRKTDANFTETNNQIVISTAADTIVKVEPQIGAAGQAQVAYYAAEMTCEDWAANLAFVDGDFTVATITFTIAPAN